MQNLVKIIIVIVAAFILFKACSRYNEISQWPDAPAVITWHKVE